MKKLVKILFFLIVLLVCVGYGLYYFGTNMASDKVMDMVSTELENSGQKEEIKAAIESDPELKKFIDEGANVDEDKLPFQTKEEATRVLVRKIGVNELQNIKSQVENGTASKEEIMNTVESNLSEEEILALKVIAYKELSK